MYDFDNSMPIDQTMMQSPWVEMRDPIAFIGTWYNANTEANFQVVPSLLLQRGYFTATGYVFLRYFDSTQNQWQYSDPIGDEATTVYFPSLGSPHLHIEVRHDRTGNDKSARGTDVDPELWINDQLFWPGGKPQRAEILGEP